MARFLFIFEPCLTSLFVASLNSSAQLTQSAETKVFVSISLGYILETKFPVRTFRLFSPKNDW